MGKEHKIGGYDFNNYLKYLSLETQKPKAWTLVKK